jgi:hypothetical protein
MRTAVQSIAAAVACLVLAGCAGPSTPTETDDLAGPPTVTDDTGAIQGLVLDDIGIGVAMAQVQLREAPEQGLALTNQAGAFQFEGLEPGRFVMDVSSIGYRSVARHVDVVAGEITEVRIELEPIAISGSFSSLEILEGKIVCGSGVIVVTQVACGSALDEENQRFLFQYEVEAENTGVLWEVAWTPTQALSRDLVFAIEADGCGALCESSSRFAEVSGCCQLRVALGDSQLDIEDVKAGSEGAVIQSRTFPSYTAGDGVTPTFYLEQEFTIYVEYFWGDLPPDFAEGRSNLPDA